MNDINNLFCDSDNLFSDTYVLFGDTDNLFDGDIDNLFSDTYVLFGDIDNPFNGDIDGLFGDKNRVRARVLVYDRLTVCMLMYVLRVDDIVQTSGNNFIRHHACSCHFFSR